MYYYDHSPPHIHAKYSGYETLIKLNGEILQGELPTRANKIVQEWINGHQHELHENWLRAKSGEPLNYISPLE